MRHTAESMSEEERAKWLAEGQVWFDNWQGADFPVTEENLRHAYDLLGLEQSFQVGAILKAKGDMTAAMFMADLAVEEADEIAEDWKGKHGEQYHSFHDLVEFSMHDIKVHGSFLGNRTEGIDFADWHQPNISAAYLMKGSLVYDCERIEESITWHEKAIEVDPVSALTLMEIAECHKLLGNMEEGLAYGKRALEVSWQLPVIAKARRTIAFCEGELGHQDLCAANLIIANDYDPSPIVANELLWLRSQGWCGQMPLDDALSLAPEETEGFAASNLAQEAMVVTMKMIEEGGIRDIELLRDLMANLIGSERKARHDAMGMGGPMGGMPGVRPGSPLSDLSGVEPLKH